MKSFICKFNLIFFVVISTTTFTAVSQNNLTPSCGTVTTAETLTYFNDIKPQLKNYQSQFLNFKSKGSKTSKGNSSKPITKKQIPIKVHIIRSSDGSEGLSDNELEEAIANLNETFVGAFMEFFICDGINYIDNNTFYQFKSDKEKSLVDANYVSGMINIYFTDAIANASNESICGYTYNKKDYDVIMMQNDCATNSSSLAHEIGHYFSLIHTHGADNSQLTKELVNGSNCSSEGDQICDTPADPHLTCKNVNNFCKYIGDITDANGDLFQPDTKNIMSYSYKGCRSNFSEQQLARMYAYYMTVKNYLSCGGDSNKDQVAVLTEIKVYPNPISGNLLYVKLNNTEAPSYFEISNLMGQVFVSGIVKNEPIQVDHLSSGAYLITIKNKYSKISKRLIK